MPTAPAPPPAAPPPGPPRDPTGVKTVASHAAKLYRTMDTMDRMGGGGFTLSTIVKLAGWAGLIAVVAALVMKMRQVQADLDPVANGVVRLQADIEAARGSLRAEADKSTGELMGLAVDAARLRDAIQKSAEAHRQGSQSVADADAQAKALADKLSTEAAALAQVQQQRGQLVQELAQFTQAVQSARTDLSGAAAKGGDEARALDDALGHARDRAAALDKAVTALDAAPAQAALARVEQNANDLSKALERATARARALEQAIASKTPPITAGQKLSDVDQAPHGK